jgi:quercetin dioxygenase-like cupin family protein
MRRLFLTIALLAFAGVARTATVTPVYAHDLPDIAGKEGTILTVVLAPGETSPVHRHNADVFVYVLSGAIVMQVKGGTPETLHAGQTFYEAPSDIHVVGDNASKTEPAKFIAFFVKDKGAPPVVPVPLE